MTYFFTFILGAFVGSFLNVVALRLGTGLSIWTGRSRCFSCGKILIPLELIPVISFLFLRGRCASCGSPISLQYPIVEVVTGVVFALLYSLFSQGIFNTFYFLVYLAIFCTLIVVVIYDLKHKIIPDRPALIFGVLALTVALGRFSSGEYGSDNLRYLDLAIGPLWFLPFYAIWKLSGGRWMGLGDGKLAIGIGWLLGFAESLSAVALSFWIGALWAGLIFLLQKLIRKPSLREGRLRLTMKSEVPLAPFLVAGTIIVFFTHLDVFSLQAFGF